MASNFLITIVYKALCVKAPPDACTMDRIWREVSWSLRILADGVWPAADSSGHAFLRGTPDGDRAGTPLAGGWRCVLWTLRGDLDHMCSAYGLNHYGSNSPCWACQANRRECPWTDVRSPAIWEATCWTNADWFAAHADRHPLFRLPGVGILAVAPDLMHCWYGGVLQYFFGSVLYLLVRDLMPAAPEANTQQLWVDLQGAYGAHRVTCELRTLRTSMFFPKEGDKFPKLRCRAAEVQGLVGPLLDIWNLRHDQQDTAHARILLSLRLVLRIETTLSDHRRDYSWPAAVAQDFRENVFNFLRLQAAVCDGYQLVGRWLFHVTIKSHYMAHIALRAHYSNPCLAWCFAGEDLMGRVKHWVAAAHHGRRPEQVVRTVIDKYCFGIGYTLLGRYLWRR